MFDLGWIPVERNAYIDHDLNNNPLWIKTDSELGSEEWLVVGFYNSDGQSAGGIRIRFSNTLDYWIDWCSISFEVFSTNPPTTRIRYGR